MDIGTVKKDMLELRRKYKAEKKISFDVVILFGSQAEGRARPDSDIDLAIVSRDFGKSRINESSLLNMLASKFNSSYEIIPISLKDYLDPNSSSPILNEIKKHGIVLF